MNLWGKNLYDYLEEVYYKQCKYAIMFISEHYARKLWTNKERISAQARAFQEKSEYIFPARFDNTEISGILPTIGYIDISNKSPEEFAELIKLKVMSPIESDLKLVDHYPKLGEKIRMEDVKNIYLKFNHPIDRDTQGLIRNYYIQANSVCQ